MKHCNHTEVYDLCITKSIFFLDRYLKQLRSSFQRFMQEFQNTNYCTNIEIVTTFHLCNCKGFTFMEHPFNGCC